MIEKDNFTTVSGSSYEMGFQQGQAFSGQIRKTFGRLMGFEGMKLVKPMFIPTFLFGLLVKKEISRKWKHNIKILLPNQYQRLCGISDGSRASINELLAIQALEVMADDVSLVKAGCFAAVFLPPRTEKNELVLIKNFDFIAEFNDDNLLRFSQPRGKYASMELTYKQITGSHDGMNEKGLVLAYNYGLTTEKLQERLPITLLIQEILENCASVEEALSLVKNFRFPNAAILTLADRNNHAASVEITPEHMAVRKPENGIIVNTNFFLSPEMQKYDLPRETKYSDKAPEGIRGRRIHETNELRYGRAIELIKNKPKLNLQDMLAILKDHNNTAGSEDTICRHGGFFKTQVSAAFCPARRKVYVSFGYPCSSEFIEYIF